MKLDMVIFVNNLSTMEAEGPKLIKGHPVLWNKFKFYMWFCYTHKKVFSSELLFIWKKTIAQFTKDFINYNLEICVPWVMEWPLSPLRQTCPTTLIPWLYWFATQFLFSIIEISKIKLPQVFDLKF